MLNRNAERLLSLAVEFAENSQRVLIVLPVDSKIHPTLGANYKPEDADWQNEDVTFAREVICQERRKEIVDLFLSGGSFEDLCSNAAKDDRQIFFVCHADLESLKNALSEIYEIQIGPNELDVDEQYFRKDGAMLCMFNNVY